MLKPFADEDSVYRLLEPVQRAPSVHNTQPWYFRIVADDRIDICARFGDGGRHRIRHERERAAPGVPCPAPRAHHQLWCRPVQPAAGHPGDLHDLAVLAAPRRFRPAGPRVGRDRDGPDEAAHRHRTGTRTDAIPRRHTNRWPYDNRHLVPIPILVAMQHAAAREQGRLRVLSRRQVRTWLRAAHGADREQRDGQGYQPDLAQWTNGGDSGVPAAAFGPPGTFGEDHHLWRHLGRRSGYAPIRDFRPRTSPGTGAVDQTEGPGGQRRPPSG